MQPPQQEKKKRNQKKKKTVQRRVWLKQHIINVEKSNGPKKKKKVEKYNIDKVAFEGKQIANSQQFYHYGFF